MREETFRWVVASGVAIVSVAMLAMAAVTVVLVGAVARLQSKVDNFIDRASPMVDSVHQLVNENSPKIGGILDAVHETVGHTRDISVIARDQANRFAEVGRDVTDRAKVQVARVDAIVEEAVEQAQHVGENVKAAVARPINEFTGVLAGIRAGVSAYAQGRRPNVARVTQDEEMFI